MSFEDGFETMRPGLTVVANIVKEVQLSRV